MRGIKYHARSLSVRWRTTVAAAAGIAMVAFMIAATLMLVAALEKGMTTVDRTDTAIVVRMSADNEFSSSIYQDEAAAVATKPGVAYERGTPLALPELVVAATLRRHDGERASVQLRGVTDDVLTVRSTAAIIAGRAPRWSAGEVLIGERLRGRFAGFEVGDSFELRKGRRLKVAGVFRAGAAYDSEVWVARELARTTFGREGRVSSVYVRLASSDAFDQFQTALEADKRLGLQAFRERDYFQIQTEGRASLIEAASSLVGVLFGFGAMLGAMITMFAAVESRYREIGTLRALGFSRLTILRGFLLESSIVALCAGLAGTLGAAMLAFTSFTMLDINSRAEVVLHFQPTPEVLAAGLGGALVMGLAGGILPAWRAARLSILFALRTG